MKNDECIGKPMNNNYTIIGRNDETIYIHGRRLGFATSHRDTHDHLLAPGSTNTVCITDQETGQRIVCAAPGTRCSACRWFEVRLYAVAHEFDTVGGEIPRRGTYLVVTSGVSIVPGEIIMRRASWTDSPYEVVELLTQRRGERPFLPTPSARVLSQAAAWDNGIRDAYIDRAVV